MNERITQHSSWHPAILVAMANTHTLVMFSFTSWMLTQLGITLGHPTMLVATENTHTMSLFASTSAMVSRCGSRLELTLNIDGEVADDYSGWLIPLSDDGIICELEHEVREVSRQEKRITMELQQREKEASNPNDPTLKTLAKRLVQVRQQRTRLQTA